jgi:hypothetical protein
MGRTMDVEAALAEAQEKIAARRREKEAMQSRGSMIESDVVDREPDPYMDPPTYAKDISGRRTKGGDMAALKTALESDWDLSEAESKARALVGAASIPRRRGLPFSGDAEWAVMSPDERAITARFEELAPKVFRRRLGQPSAGRSVVLGEYRADPAWEAGFQSVLMNRNSYSLADLDGSGLRADGARDGVLVSRGDTDSLNDLGRSEALEFLEREAKKVERQSLIEGMQ